MDPAASASLNTSYVLKDGDSFLIASRLGDVEGGADGLFHNDTRILSRYRLVLGDTAPMLLSSYVTRDNVFFVSHLTNRQLPPLGNDAYTGQGLVYIKRMRFLHADRLYERVVLQNYGSIPAHVPLTFEVDADFCDMFEVRGSTRSRRGESLPTEILEHGQIFRYRGLDSALRSSSVAFSATPTRVAAGTVEFEIQLPAGGRHVTHIEVGGEMALPARDRFRAAAALARSRMRRRARSSARICSDGPLFN